jgi:carotenoid 1,2-hydratase
LSDDGRNGLTIIGFVGSVFSPYYKQARKHGRGDPENHCAINVAIYGTTRRWAMTERGARHVVRTPRQFSVGPSAMAWNDAGLSIEINERCVPLPFRLRGSVTITPGNLYDSPIPLDAAGRHHWQAVAPHGQIKVEFSNPHLSWSGSAYHDMNWGEEPLELAFKHWTWLRTKTTHGTRVLYDVRRQDGSRFAFGRNFQDRNITEQAVPEYFPLRRGLWGMKRDVQSETPPKLLKTLEDTPFYTRNHVELTLNGIRTDAFHESLSLERFVNPAVQVMLPFRMPRFS